MQALAGYGLGLKRILVEMIDGSSLFLLLSFAMTVFAFRFHVENSPFPQQPRHAHAKFFRCTFELCQLATR